MKNGFNEWDDKPLYLSSVQIENPLLVINDFFNYDSLDGHLKRLTNWRDFILRDVTYKVGREGALSLYGFYKTNLALVDAAQLLLKAWPEKALSEDYSDSILPFENVLSSLSDSERLEIYSTLTTFFANLDLYEYREQLEEWLENGLSDKSLRHEVETKDLIIVYENLQRLYASSWLLYFHDRMKLDIGHTPYSIEDEPRHRFKEADSIYKLNNSINSRRYEIIKKLVNTINLKLPAVKAIIYLGEQPAREEKIFLLVLVSNKEQRFSQSLNSMIEESCEDIAPVVAITHHSSWYLNKLEANNAFANYANSCPVIYLSGDQMIPSPKPIDQNGISETETFKWERWFNQGKNFLYGADFFIRNKMHGEALFLLNQSAGCILSAIIKAVLGYDIDSHNISRMLSVSEMFTTELSEVLKSKETGADIRFEMLKDAYSEISYRDTFEPDIIAIELLYRDINELATKTEDIYHKYSLQNTL